MAKRNARAQAPMDDRGGRIRRRAYGIWEREGRPEGRAAEHWELASEEVAIEDNLEGTLRPNPSRGPYDTAERTEPVEPVLSMENQGETPGLADQGEEFRIPGAAERQAVPEPTESPTPARRPRRKSAG